MTMNLRGRYHAAGDAVNLIFVGPDGEGKVLFEQDVRINQYELSRDEEKTPYNRHPFLLERNIYLVTTSDTNKDGFLNYEDAQTLYVSSTMARTSRSSWKTLSPIKNSAQTFS